MIVLKNRQTSRIENMIEGNIEERRKRTVVSIVVLLILPVNIIFTIDNYLKGQDFDFIAALLLAVNFILVLIYLHRFNNSKAAYTIMLYSTSFFLFYLLFFREK